MTTCKSWDLASAVKIGDFISGLNGNLDSEAEIGTWPLEGELGNLVAHGISLDLSFGGRGPNLISGRRDQDSLLRERLELSL